MTYDVTPLSAVTWPPEVPPFRPPEPPAEPTRTAPPAPAPSILPTWEERDEPLLERDVADRLLEHRVVMLGGRLDDAAADRAAAQLLLLGRGSDAVEVPVELHLACPEAELGAALALADAVDLVAAPVHGVARGTVTGPALAVLCAADRRVAHPNTVFVMSVPDALPGQVELHRVRVGQLLARLADATGRDQSELAADLGSGQLLSAQDAVGYGLLHGLR